MRHPYRPMILVALLLLVVIASTRAQETLVPIDSAGTIDRIDPALEARLNLFPGTTGFREARLYRQSDSIHVLEITFVADGREQRTRQTLGAAETATFRNTVTARLRESAPEALRNQEGRSRLIAGSTILGLGYYGPAAVFMSGAEDRAAVAVYLFTAAGSFFIPYVATQKSDVTHAQASLSLYGLTLGALHGHLLYWLVAGEPTGDGSGSFATSMLTGIVEGYVGYAIAGRNNLSEGTTGVMISYGTFGTAFGAGGAFLLGAEDVQPLSAGMLLGSVGGLLAGHAVAQTQTFTVGDASVMTTTGIVAAYAPVGLLLAGGYDDDADGKVFVASAMAGAVGGLFLGAELVRGRQFSEAQGNYIALGTLATTGLAIGLAYLMSSDNADGQLYAVAGLVGSVGGLGLMYSLLEDDAERELGSSLKLDISPVGIGALVTGRRPDAASTAVVPLATLQYTF